MNGLTAEFDAFCGKNLSVTWATLAQSFQTALRKDEPVQRFHWRCKCCACLCPSRIIHAPICVHQYAPLQNSV
jgi:hypothetical protein